MKYMIYKTNTNAELTELCEMGIPVSVDPDNQILNVYLKESHFKREAIEDLRFIQCHHNCSDRSIRVLVYMQNNMEDYNVLVLPSIGPLAVNHTFGGLMEGIVSYVKKGDLDNFLRNIEPEDTYVY